MSILDKRGLTNKMQDLIAKFELETKFEFGLMYHILCWKDKCVRYLELQAYIG